jgi:hypothetical protein
MRPDLLSSSSHHPTPINHPTPAIQYHPIHPPPPPPPQEEFTSGVEELAKAKLEKPKRLGELAQRWWAEIYRGTLRFDRRETEVAVLRSLTREDLAAFARRVLAPSEGRRKLLVMVRGAAERRGAGEDAEAGAGEVCGSGGGSSTVEEQRAAAAAAVGEGETVLLVTDAAAYKRRCELYAAAQPAEGPEGEGAGEAAGVAEE